MRALIFVGALAAACVNDPGEPPGPMITPRACTPESAGLGEAMTFAQPAFSLPAGCRIFEDDGRTAIFRRQVTRIEDAAALALACQGPAGDAGVAHDGGADAPMIDFSTSTLLLIRVPDTSLPRWSVVESDGRLVFGESTAICTGIDPKPLRYLRVVPKTATVTFHLCAPEGCEEESG